MNIIDISSNNEYPGNALSNFTPHRFVFDQIICLSPEGLLQSLKFSNFLDQKKICKLIGKEAKKLGRKQNEQWQKIQTLYWRNKAYARDSPGYQILLDKIFKALAKKCIFSKGSFGH